MKLNVITSDDEIKMTEEEKPKYLTMKEAISSVNADAERMKKEQIESMQKELEDLDPCQTCEMQKENERLKKEIIRITKINASLRKYPRQDSEWSYPYDMTGEQIKSSREKNWDRVTELRVLEDPTLLDKVKSCHLCTERKKCKDFSAFYNSSICEKYTVDTNFIEKIFSEESK